MLLVLCLEGVHGAGKSELCRLFAEDGYQVLDEGFLDMPDYAIHPQSLLMETTWVCSWFSRVLQLAREQSAEALKRGSSPAPQVVIADRSPFSAVLYSRQGGSLLEPVIRQHIAEVAKEAHVHVATVYVRVPRDLLWDRILARLAREPHRARYNEGDHSWMETAMDFYEKFRWDLVVPNDGELEHLLARTKAIVADSFVDFAHTLHSPHPSPSPIFDEKKSGEGRRGEGRESAEATPPIERPRAERPSETSRRVRVEGGGEDGSLETEDGDRSVAGDEELKELDSGFPSAARSSTSTPESLQKSPTLPSIMHHDVIAPKSLHKELEMALEAE